MQKILAILVCGVAVMLAGCNPDPGTPASKWQYVPDQALRAQRFDACMQALPAGPKSTHYNDWSEVVDSCGDIAYRQSLRLAQAGPNGAWFYQDGTPVK